MPQSRPRGQPARADPTPTTRRFPLSPRIEPVDRAKALRLICPLPDGTVTGLQQVARRGDMVVTAELTQTIRVDTWDGVRIRIVSPSAGAVDANWFGFSEHGVFNERHRAPSARDGGRELTAYNAEFMLTYASVDAYRLRDAVAEYTSVFTPAPAPEFTAAAHLGVLDGMARRLDHLGSVSPQSLAGRAHAHAEVLREVIGEIHISLLPLTGERLAADDERVDLPDALAALGQVSTALTELALSAEEAGHAGQAQVFREHAQALGAIGEEITTDLAADPSSQLPDTARAGRSAAARAGATAVALSPPSAGAVVPATPPPPARLSR
ncbi:hypothetical protein ACWCYY_11105 [Kitasatospora sp. NPDC001664]